MKRFLFLVLIFLELVFSYQATIIGNKETNIPNKM